MNPNCSIARTLAIIGDRWTLLVLRELFRNNGRFDGLQGTLGVASNVLAQRLQNLTGHGLVERHPYQERPLRYEYRLTEKGLSLFPVLLALMSWGDEHLAPEGPPAYLRHRECGKVTRPGLNCSECGGELRPQDVRLIPGPGWNENGPSA